MRDAEVVELRMVMRVGNLSSHEFWSATIFVFLRRNEIIMFLPAFYHAVGLGMTHAGRGVLDVEFGT